MVWPMQLENNGACAHFGGCGEVKTERLCHDGTVMAILVVVSHFIPCLHAGHAIHTVSESERMSTHLRGVGGSVGHHPCRLDVFQSFQVPPPAFQLPTR